MAAAAEHTRAELGDAMFAALAVYYMLHASDGVGGSRFDAWGWPRLRQGFADWTQRVPEAIEARHAQAYIAFLTDHPERAMELFALPEVAWSHFAQPVWKDRFKYDYFRQQAQERNAELAARRAREEHLRSLPPPPSNPAVTHKDVVLIVDAELADGSHHRLNGFLADAPSGAMAVTAGAVLAGEPNEIRRLTFTASRNHSDTWAVDGSRQQRTGAVIMVALDAGSLPGVTRLSVREDAPKADDPVYLPGCPQTSECLVQPARIAAEGGKDGDLPIRADMYAD